MNDIYTKQLEEENEKLRKQLADSQLETDAWKPVWEETDGLLYLEPHLRKDHVLVLPYKTNITIAKIEYDPHKEMYVGTTTTGKHICSSTLLVRCKEITEDHFMKHPKPDRLSPEVSFREYDYSQKIPMNQISKKTFIAQYMDQ